MLNDNFNPRSRVGSDDSIRTFEGKEASISIHAPAWGATNPPAHLLTKQSFQSTLPRGERRKQSYRL